MRDVRGFLCGTNNNVMREGERGGVGTRTRVAGPGRGGVAGGPHIHVAAAVVALSRT